MVLEKPNGAREKSKEQPLIIVEVRVLTLLLPTTAASLLTSAGTAAPGVCPIQREFGGDRVAGRKGAMGKLTDRELADRARDGDRSAFGELVRRHHPRIHRLATHMLRDHAEAEDVAQETFIRAYRAIARFDGRSEPYTWFYRITVNLSLNVLRSRKPQRRTPGALDELDGPRSRSDAVAAALVASDPPVDAASRQLYEALAQGIDELSDTLRTTLLLVCIDGRSHEEAAVILGAPEGTIAWRVHEARRKLREYMVGRGFGEGEEASGR
jgi:RNA polymerase sigma-70 factor (ECF subfamily)